MTLRSHKTLSREAGGDKGVALSDVLDPGTAMDDKEWVVPFSVIDPDTCGGRAGRTVVRLSVRIFQLVVRSRGRRLGTLTQKFILRYSTPFVKRFVKLTMSRAELDYWIVLCQDSRYNRRRHVRQLYGDFDGEQHYIDFYHDLWKMDPKSEGWVRPPELQAKFDDPDFVALMLRELELH